MEYLISLFLVITSKSLFLTMVLGALIYICYRLSLRYVKGLKSATKTNRRRLMVGARNGWLCVFIGLMVFVWFDQIHHMATGLLVVAAALVIATKELIMNFLGYLYKSATHPFQIGDRIQVTDIYGDVIDQGFMGVTLMEIAGAASHQYTGRSVFVPNCVFLSNQVYNESFLHDYCFHMITIPVKKTDDWEKHERALLLAAQEISAPYLDEAQAFMNKVEKHYSLDAPSTEPLIHLHVESEELISIGLRVPVLTSKRGRLEQAMTRRYLELVKSGAELSESGGGDDSPGEE